MITWPPFWMKPNVVTQQFHSWQGSWSRILKYRQDWFYQNTLMSESEFPPYTKTKTIGAIMPRSFGLKDGWAMTRSWQGNTRTDSYRFRLAREIASVKSLRWQKWGWLSRICVGILSFRCVKIWVLAWTGYLYTRWRQKLIYFCRLKRGNEMFTRIPDNNL